MEVVRKAGSPLAFSCCSYSVQSTLASDMRVTRMSQCNFATSRNSKKKVRLEFSVHLGVGGGGVCL